MRRPATLHTCNACRCEVRQAGLILLDTGDQTSRLRLCCTCLTLRLQTCVDLLHPEEARTWLLGCGFTAPSEGTDPLVTGGR